MQLLNNVNQYLRVILNVPGSIESAVLKLSLMEEL